MRMKSDHQPPPPRMFLSKETKNQLRDILPLFEKNIANLVQDTNSMYRVFLAIKGNPSPALSRVLSPLSIFED